MVDMSLETLLFILSKVHELIKICRFLFTAILAALSHKGPWQLSRTLATQTSITNQWLMDQNLSPAKELWVNIHYPDTAQ